VHYFFIYVWIFVTTLKYFFSACSYTNTLCISLWTYAIISWWCRTQAFNLACKSQFAIVWTCSSPSPWCGVMCSCLISSMAAFSLSNWVQATAINVITRDRKLQIIPRARSVAKHCEKVKIYNLETCYIEKLRTVMKLFKLTTVTITVCVQVHLSNLTTAFFCFFYGTRSHNQ
jgi:hypothetical protein